MPLCWFSLVKILKPEQLDQKAFDSLREAAAEAGRPTNYEVRALIMILALPVLWILGTWIPVLNVTTVAIIGLAIMFIPGINLLTWEEFSASVPWTIILMVGAVLSLGNMFSATGADVFVTNLFMSSGVASLNFTLFLLITVVFIYLLHTIAPVGAAIISLFLPILIGICTTLGVSPAIPTMLLAFIVARQLPAAGESHAHRDVRRGVLHVRRHVQGRRHPGHHLLRLHDAVGAVHLRRAGHVVR